MTGSEILFLIATILALAALAVSVTTPRKSQDRLPTFARDHDVEDAEIITEKMDVKR